MASDLKTSVAAAAIAGCVADLATFPLDTAKVRLQVQGVNTALMAALPRSSSLNLRVHQPPYQGMFGTIGTIAREEGPRALYNGLTAGLKRQMCLASIRLGLYEPTKQFYQDIYDYGFATKSSSNGEFHIGCRILAGITTGATAVLFAQPPDVVTVRFQAAAKGSGHKYSSIFGAYRKITKHEGLTGLWRGMFPNVTKNVLITVAEIVCYDITKDTLLLYKLLDEGIPLHFCSAAIAGFCATVVASPVDVVKTRCMNAPQGEYKNAMDCAMRLVNHDGVGAFYKGFLPSVCRFMSWNIVMWMSFEHIKTIMTSYNNEEENFNPIVA